MHLTACPQCDAPMANQCGATCQGCHFKYGCQSEPDWDGRAAGDPAVEHLIPCGSDPSPTITADSVARTMEELASTLHRVSRPTLRVNHPLPIDPDNLAEALERSRGRVVADDPDAGRP